MNRSRVLRPLLLALAGITGMHAAAFAASSCTLTGLKWMAGDWHNAASPSAAQERWSVAPGGILMGSSWEVTHEGKGYAEIMTVREETGSIQMVLRHFDLALSRAWEEQSAPMLFIASKCDGSSAVFDGQDAHAGEHLTYARSGETLTIVGDFLHHGKPDHEEWQMILAKD